MRQVHKVVLMVVDFDDLGEEGIIQQLESARRLPASVREIDTRDIDWDDSHPLNSETHWREKFDELFGNAPAAVEQVDALTDEQADAILLNMAAHVEEWADGLGHEPTSVECSGKAMRFILAATQPAAPVQPAADIDTLNYEWLATEAKAAGFETVIDAILYARQVKAAPVQAAPK